MRAAILPTAALAAVLWAACGSGDRPLDQVDPDAVPANPTYEQVYAILDNRCVVCHSGNNAVRRTVAGATDTVRATAYVPDFTRCTAVVAERDIIVERIEDNTMPPGALPRLTSEQKLLIHRWVDNGAPAPCN